MIADAILHGTSAVRYHLSVKVEYKIAVVVKDATPKMFSASTGKLLAPSLTAKLIKINLGFDSEI